MPHDRSWLDADRFDRFRPALDTVTSLDLNWAHGLNEQGRNIGLEYLYSIGNTGHRYVCACVLPGVAPENFPVAIVNEEGYTVDVFASSIASWLPCYVVRIGENLLGTALWRNRTGRDIPWLDEAVATFSAEADAITAALADFDPPAAGGALTTILTLLDRMDSLTVNTWRPATLYAAVEPDGYVAAYRRLAASRRTTPAEWRSLIRSFPWYNKPLFHQFRVGARPAAPELALEVFHRRITHDSDGVPSGLLDRAARLVTDAAVPIAAPVDALIREIAADGADDVMLGEAYFRAGQRWEREDGADPVRAMACYENAIQLHDIEAEEWHDGAVVNLRRLAADSGDANYRRTIAGFLPPYRH